MPIVQTKPKRSLKAKAIRGSLWTIFGFGSSQVLRLGGNVVLARLLFPAAFGLMAIVNIFLQGLQLFSDIGIAPSIIQNKRGNDPVFLNTAWTIQTIRGVGLWLASCALAWPVALFYGEPALRWLIPVAGLTAFVAGFSPTSLITMTRRLAVGKLTGIDLCAQLAGIAVMIAGAFIHRSVWPLVFGSIATALAYNLLGRVVLPQRNWFTWDRESARALLTFGQFVFASTALLFVAKQSGRLILGKFITFEMLGVYGVAHGLAQTGTNIVERLLGRVFFPGIAQLYREKPERVPQQYARLRRVLDAGSIGFVVLMVLGGPIIIRLMYDSRYWGATWMVQILAIQVAWDIMRAPAGYLLLAAGKPAYGAWANLARAIVLWVGLPTVFLLMGADRGMKPAMWVIALSSAPQFLIYLIGVSATFPRLAKTECVAGIVGFGTLPVAYWLLH